MRAFFEKLEKNKALINIRAGLVVAIPVLLLGSFALLFNSLIDLAEVNNIAINFLQRVLTVIYDSTFGILSLIMAFTISSKWFQNQSAEINPRVGVVSVLISFLILNGGLVTADGSSNIGVKSMFTAILVSTLASWLFIKLSLLARKLKLVSLGGDLEFQDVLNSALPFSVTIVIFALFNEIIASLTGLNSLNEYLVWIVEKLSEHMTRNLLSAVLFILFIGVFWIFGIHGSNVLEPMTQQLFTPAIEINEKLVAAGEAPTEIFSKTFFDVFALMGGCGATLSLLFAIFIFSRNRRNRKIAITSAPVMLFNINEIMVFGLPIVLNPILIIPFLITPVVMVITSFLAMQTGLVPLPINEVQWNIPFILSGYLATGSIAGSLLQIFNIGIGILIYAPFVKMYDDSQTISTTEQMNNVVNCLKEAETTGKPIVLMSKNDDVGYVARSLGTEIMQAIQMEKIKIYYQPQYDKDNNCIGVEALLRYHTETYGFIYPPLVIQLARESGNLVKLEEYIFKNVLKNINEIYDSIGGKVKLSINITPDTLVTDEFVNFLKGYTLLYDKNKVDICIEVTERTYLDITPRVEKIFEQLHKLGYTLAIDDFSMGSTSIKYLKKNYFDEVKLDGELVRNVNGNGNEREIICSVISLAKSLNIDVVSEYVENIEIKQELEDLGCELFQGYLYSPAVEASELKNVLNDFKDRIEISIK